ncbi:SRPBCC family protein [Catenulispora yoronensis]|uniref:SRPBCC family protein n=1 Tax=Catenulispora yoronensis TaxID=450799 RepID=A0ABP5F341_9ACTN
MSTVEAAVEVDVPISTAYNQWTQFTSFPQFMNGVEEVRQLDDTHNHWVVKVGGVRREFDTEITQQLPDRLICWQTVGGDVRQVGNVGFERLDDEHTRVVVQMEWTPDGLAEKLGSTVGLDTRQVKADVERFKTFIEHRNTETGAWRGEVGPQAPQAREAGFRQDPM